VMKTGSILLSVPESYEFLRIKRDKFYRLLRDGDIKAKKLGGRTLILRAELERFAKSLPDLTKTRPDRAAGHSRKRKAA
jgi:excisionase family DNA binding protein